MSGTHSQAAVARTPGRTPPQSGSRRRARGLGGAVPTLRARRVRLFGLGAGQLIACELAALGVLFSLAGPVWALGASGVAAVVILVFALGRSKGRWLYEAMGVRLAYRRRRRGSAQAARAPAAGDMRLDLLREISPALTAHNVTTRSGERVGVIGDGLGWAALLRVEPGEGLVASGEPPRVPLDVLAAALDMRGIPLAGVQVLAHTVPPLPGNLPFVHSYQQLAGHPVPPRRSLWVALRLDPRLAREAVDQRGGGATGAHRALLASASRLAVALGTAGVPARLLDIEETLAALAACTGSVPWQRSQRGPRTLEDWTGWTCDGVQQTCFWIRKWPPAASVGRLLTQLSEASGVPTVVSLTLTGQDDGMVSFRGMVRATGKPDELAERLQRIAGAAGGSLARLDGEHGAAVLATLPLGGGAL